MTARAKCVPGAAMADGQALAPPLAFQVHAQAGEEGETAR